MLRSFLKSLPRIRDFFWEISLVSRTLSAKKPASRFVVYGSARTGTTICASLLSAHVDLVSEHEIFNRYHIQAKKDFDSIYREIGLGYTPPLFFPLYSIENVAKYKCDRLQRSHYCFKYLTSQMELSEERKFIQGLARKGWKILHVVRQDLLQVAISYYVAFQNLDKPGAWFGAKSDKCMVNPKQLIELLERFEREQEEQRAILADVPHLQLTYEEDYLDSAKHQEVCNRIFEYVEMSSCTVHSSLKKQGSECLSERVENWEEVRNALMETRFKVFMPSLPETGVIAG